jgi:hypothetical protein
MCDRSHLSEQALESRARRAAQRAGLFAKKSRWRRGTVDNYGGFTLINPQSNWIVAGERFDLSAQDVLEYCAEASHDRAS